MRMAAPTALLSCVLVACLASVAQAAPFRSATGHFVIALPAGWTPSDTQDSDGNASVRAAEPTHAGDGLLDHAAIELVSKVLPKLLTTAQLGDREQELLHYRPGVVGLQRDLTTLGGQPAFRLRARYPLAQLGSQPVVQAETLVVGLAWGKRHYTVTLIAPIREFDRQRLAFERVIRSIKLLP